MRSRASCVRLSLIDYRRETFYGYFMSSPVCSLSSYIFQFLFHLLPAYLSIAYRGLNARCPLLRDVPKIVRHFFKRPACLACPVGEVVAQVMESEIVNQFPLPPGGTSLERPKPVVDSFLGQALTTLGCKDVGSISISTRLEILIERLSCLIHEIDVAPLSALITNIQPPDFRTNMRMGHLQPGDITDPASGPVTERENGSATPILLLLNQRAQDIALIL